MPELLALFGLLIATLLYFLLVRRRASLRQGVRNLRDALTASNEIALQRLHLRPASGATAPPVQEANGIVADRRSGKDRRGPNQRRFGRGRRTGGDRRRNSP